MTLHHGDCLDVMAAMEPESVDAIVTDPPYGLEFMGKDWDRLDRGQNRKAASYTASGRHGGDTDPFTTHMSTYRGGTPAQAFHAAWAEAAIRVARPGAYLLAFGGTRTVHRMTVALEDAGWIIRDMLVWGYASGFPKSKASLKPAWEPIVLARKPGPLRMLAIDECRIPAVDGGSRVSAVRSEEGINKVYGKDLSKPGPVEYETPEAGRWPANIVLTDPIFDGGVEGVVGGGETNVAWTAPSRGIGQEHDRTHGKGLGEPVGASPNIYGDSGTYSRFFLIPKADRADREPVLGGLPLAKFGGEGHALRGESAGVDRDNRARANVHPTVKPTDLMRHLVRLVTPTGGTVLDPFLGSGTTAIAAEMEGFAWIGIEREAEYVAIAEARLNGTQRGLGLESA